MGSRGEKIDLRQVEPKKIKKISTESRGSRVAHVDNDDVDKKGGEEEESRELIFHRRGRL